MSPLPRDSLEDSLANTRQAVADMLDQRAPAPILGSTDDDTEGVLPERVSLRGEFFLLCGVIWVLYRL